MAQSRPSSGFTLLELVLVLVIISIAMMIAAPSLANFARGREASNTAAQFVATAHWARSQAISDGAIYRINIDAPGRRWWLTYDDGNNFVPVGSMYGQAFTAPESVRIESDAPASPDATQIIEFDPSGRVDPATVRFIGSVGAPVEVVALSPMDTYHVVTPAGGQP